MNRVCYIAALRDDYVDAVRGARAQHLAGEDITGSWSDAELRMWRRQYYAFREGFYKTVTIGPRTWFIFWLWSSFDDAKDFYQAVNPTGKLQILGAWWARTGIPVGLVHTGGFDPADRPILADDPALGFFFSPDEVLGAGLTRADALLAVMPDDVVYDEDGNEVSRTPATDYKMPHRMLGQPDTLFPGEYVTS